MNRIDARPDERSTIVTDALSQNDFDVPAGDLAGPHRRSQGSAHRARQVGSKDVELLQTLG